MDATYSLHWLDLVIIAIYFALILATGFWFGRGERDTKDFFLGARRQPWFVVSLSIIATEVSAITFLIVPGNAFAGDWWYLQMYAGSVIGRLLIVYLLLPAYYRSNVTTIYEYLGQRFGPWTRATASLMFMASRVIGSGIRLLAASLAIAVVFDCPLHWVVIAAASVAIAYTSFGGIKSIIWTDALQALVFLGGAGAVLVYLFLQTPGSWSENLLSLSEAGKLQCYRSGFNFTSERLFWVLLIHATVQNLAALGADQDLTQRMLTCPDIKRSQRALLFNTVAGLPIVCTFLLIGSMLYLWQQHTSASLSIDTTVKPNQVFAVFIMTSLPAGLKGLLIAGIFSAAMSSVDSALGALSSTAVMDFYKPYVKRNATETHYLTISRVFTVAFGILLAVIALAFADSQNLLDKVFSWASLIFGGMLGAFLLGVLTKNRGNDRANVVAMLSSVALLVAIKFLQEHYDVDYLAWPWWVVLGTAWTVGLGACFPSGKRD